MSTRRSLAEVWPLVAIATGLLLLLVSLFVRGSSFALPALAGSENIDFQGNPAANCWQVIPSPNQGTNHNRLNGIAIAGANDVWAVGSYNDSDTTARTLIEHWNGSAWSIVPSPNFVAQSNSLESVAAISTDDVWAVGSYQIGSVDHTLIEHWNGTVWSIMPSSNHDGSPTILTGVTAKSAHDAWAVGAYYESSDRTNKTFIEHWNGTVWSIVPSPNPGSQDNELLAVSAASINDVWAVGYYSNDWISNQALFEHWDGASWSVVAGASITTGVSLHGIAEVSADNMWAVGAYFDNLSNTNKTIVEHWNGTAWAIVSSPSPGVQGNNLTAVSALSANDIWAVGTQSSTPQLKPGACT